MIARIVTAGLLAALVPPAVQAQSLLVPDGGRTITSLDGSWNSIVDPYENGYYDYRWQPRRDGYFQNRRQRDPSELVEYDFARSPKLEVPGDWNTQRPELFLYEGTVWYHRRFDYDLPPGERLFLWVGAANYDAIVWLNGEELGEHVGGFTPFWFEVTDLVRASDNDLVFKVDDRRRRDGVPTLNTDWWNYGGLTRDVLLMQVPATFVRDLVVHLDPRAPDEVVGSVVVDGAGAGRTVEVTIGDTGVGTTATTAEDGTATFRMPAGELERWSPEHPRLYDVRVAAGPDTVIERVGLRTIETRGHEILLNGDPVFLKGITLHEVSPFGGGRAHGPEDARVLLGWAKELGCNFVRLAHYPHNRFMTRMADEMGLMVWSEIPVYWTIQWENEATYALAEQQLREMIERDRNRASVVIWSVGNETPRGDARLAFMTRLIETARRLDPTRLVSAATEVTTRGDTLRLDDPLGRSLDVIGANEYLGWYGGRPDEIATHRWASSFDKPLIISEFGAGALYGLHGDEGTRWTEEYQSAVYRNQLRMLDGIPFLAGTTPWILMDFLSPRRPLPDIQDFYNRKGLISERGLRKEAFYVLRDYYRSRE